MLPFTFIRALDQDLLESVYEAFLAEELASKGYSVRLQVPVPVEYKGNRFEIGFRIVMLVDEVIVVEVKASGGIHPVNEAQLLTYLKLSGRRVGLLLNFNVALLKDGIRRLVL